MNGLGPFRFSHRAPAHSRRAHDQGRVRTFGPGEQLSNQRNRRPRRIGVWRPILAGLLVVIGVCLAIPARAQVAVPLVLDAGDVQRSRTKQNRAFSIPIQDANLLETITDFQEFVSHQAWERAVKALDAIAAGDRSKLLPANEQILVPVDAWIRGAVLALPPEGLAAYRLFYDPLARQLLDEAQGEKQRERLEAIVSRYFATSVGDEAANRLAEHCFREGEVERAAQLWQDVLDSFPDSRQPRLALLTKAAIAHLRSGHRAEFQRLFEEISTRHAGQTLELGGREVVAADHLAALLSAAGHPAQQGSGRLPEDLELGDRTPLAWQFRFLSARGNEQLAAMLRDHGRTALIGYLPPAVIDEERLFINYVGYQAVLDLASGRLQSRSGRMFELPEKLRQSPWISPERYCLATGAGAVWAVARPPEKFAHHDAPFFLACSQGASLEPRWQSDKLEPLKNFSFTGQPLAVGQRVFAAAMRTDRPTELHALCLDAASGALVWSALVGTHQNDPGQAYYQRTAQPVILSHGPWVIVDSQVGGLAVLDRQRGTLQWALHYDSEPPRGNYYYGSQQAEFPSSSLVADDVLYVKAMRSGRIYAIDLSRPAVKWDRPVSHNVAPVAVRDGQLLLAGEELAMLDTETQRLVWTNKLPATTSYGRPLVGRTKIYQFTSRGIFVLDLASGDRVGVFRGADLESMGGVLLWHAPLLITVSNLAATAYRVEPTSPTAQRVDRSGPQRER